MFLLDSYGLDRLAKERFASLQLTDIVSRAADGLHPSDADFVQHFKAAMDRETRCAAVDWQVIAPNIGVLDEMEALRVWRRVLERLEPAHEAWFIYWAERCGNEAVRQAVASWPKPNVSTSPFMAFLTKRTKRLPDCLDDSLGEYLPLGFRLQCFLTVFATADAETQAAFLRRSWPQWCFSYDQWEPEAETFFTAFARNGRITRLDLSLLYGIDPQSKPAAFFVKTPFYRVFFDDQNEARRWQERWTALHSIDPDVLRDFISCVRSLNIPSANREASSAIADMTVPTFTVTAAERRHCRAYWAAWDAEQESGKKDYSWRQEIRNLFEFTAPKPYDTYKEKWEPLSEKAVWLIRSVLGRRSIPDICMNAEALMLYLKEHPDMIRALPMSQRYAMIPLDTEENANAYLAHQPELLERIKPGEPVWERFGWRVVLSEGPRVLAFEGWQLEAFLDDMETDEIRQCLVQLDRAGEAKYTLLRLCINDRTLFDQVILPVFGTPDFDSVPISVTFWVEKLNEMFNCHRWDISDERWKTGLAVLVNRSKTWMFGVMDWAERRRFYTSADWVNVLSLKSARYFVRYAEDPVALLTFVKHRDERIARQAIRQYLSVVGLADGLSHLYWEEKILPADSLSDPLMTDDELRSLLVTFAKVPEVAGALIETYRHDLDVTGIVASLAASSPLYAPLELLNALGSDASTDLSYVLPKLRRKGQGSVGAKLDDQYHTWEIPKKSGGTRVISTPEPRLKSLQHRILRQLLDPLGVHPAAHGFVIGTNIVENAAAHVGAKVVANADVKNCFPSVPWSMVLHALRRDFAGRLQPATISLLVDICTAKGGLPIGAPSSPALLNRVLYQTDDILHRAAEKCGCHYTRYADDMTFSGDDAAVRLLGLAEKTLGRIGLTLDPKKTNIFRRGRRQCCTGLVVNDRVSIRRKTRREWRAAVHEVCCGRTPMRHHRPMSMASLKGCLNFLTMVHPEEGERLKARLAEALERQAKGSEK